MYTTVSFIGREDRPDQMIVCICNRLSEARVRGAIADGAQSPDDVYTFCGVKRNCGKCQETIAEMLHETQSQKVLEPAE